MLDYNSPAQGTQEQQQKKAKKPDILIFQIWVGGEWGLLGRKS